MIWKAGKKGWKPPPDQLYFPDGYARKTHSSKRFCSRVQNRPSDGVCCSEGEIAAGLRPWGGFAVYSYKKSLCQGKRADHAFGSNASVDKREGPGFGGMRRGTVLFCQKNPDIREEIV